MGSSATESVDARPARAPAPALPTSHRLRPRDLVRRDPHGVRLNGEWGHRGVGGSSGRASWKGLEAKSWEEEGPG